jgi:hypothetical protein
MLAPARISKRLALAIAMGLGLTWLTIPGMVDAGEGTILARSWESGDLWQVEATLEVSGQVKIRRDGKVEQVPLTVAGHVRYDEQLLDGGPDAEDPLLSVRHYGDVQATIHVAEVSAEPRLSEERRLIGAQYLNGKSTLFSPQGALTRDELDLVDTIGNSLLIDRLLPAEAIAEGDPWVPDDQLLAALLGLDAVSVNDVQCRLKSLSDDVARIEMSGLINGAIQGVASEIELTAKLKFDRKLGRITWFALLVKEDRSIGHAAPGLDVVAKLQMKITPRQESEALSPEKLEGLRLVPEEEDALLTQSSTAGGFELLHDRDWKVMSENPALMVMRRIHRGELLAQCNIAPLDKTEPGKHMGLKKFQEDVQNALGEQFGEFITAFQQVDEAGRMVHRVVVRGTASELPIEWHYYLLTGSGGQQLVLAFTMEQALVKQFGDADEKLVRQIKFVEDALQTARQPTPATQSQ